MLKYLPLTPPFFWGLISLFSWILCLFPSRGTGGHGMGAQVSSSLVNSATPLPSGTGLFTLLISNSSCPTPGAKKDCGVLTLAGCHVPTKWLYQSPPQKNKGKEKVGWKKPHGQFNKAKATCGSKGRDLFLTSHQQEMFSYFSRKQGFSMCFSIAPKDRLFCE